MRSERAFRVEFLLDPLYPNERAAIAHLKSCRNRSGYCRRAVLDSISGEKDRQIADLQARVDWLENLLQKITGDLALDSYYDRRL